MPSTDSAEGPDWDFSAIEDPTTLKPYDGDYELHENVAVDIIRYGRSRIVRNEQQFLLITLGYLTGLLGTHKHFTCGVIIGTSSSGKSHVQAQVEDLCDRLKLYQATTGTDKSLIYDPDWDKCDIASLDELQKPSEELIEFLKSVHGDDEVFTYKITGQGHGADRGADTILRYAKPYWFLFAQTQADFEMWNRLMKVPVHESKEKNKAVGATKFDWEHIQIDADEEYMFEFEEGTKALQDHIGSLPRKAWVKIPSWVWPCVEPIFDHNRSESNRVYAMVANLIRASALLNHEHRKTERVSFGSHGIHDAIIVEPQDVANVLACRSALLATTHNLDRKKKAICTAIQESGVGDGGVTIKQIKEYLDSTNASTLKRSELEVELAELIDNYFVEKHDGAGPRGAHLYEFNGWSQIGFANVDPERFTGTVDPISGRPFIQSHRDYQDHLLPSAEDFMASEADVTSGDGQMTLGGAAESDEDVELEPHEEYALALMRECVDGYTFADPAKVRLEHLLDIVPPGEDHHDAYIDFTILDPENHIWDQPGRPKDWVASVTDTRTRCIEAVKKLFAHGFAHKQVNEDGTITIYVDDI